MLAMCVGAPRRASTANLDYLASDVRRADRFYAKVFEPRVAGQVGPIGPRVGVGYLHVTRIPTDGGPVSLPCIGVRDIDDALARVWSHGGEILDTPRYDPAGGEWVARFRDPAGNVLGVCQREPRLDEQDDEGKSEE